MCVFTWNYMSIAIGAPVLLGKQWFMRLSPVSIFWHTLIPSLSMLGRYMCTDAGVFLFVCACLKGKEGLGSLGIAAVLCTTIHPISPFYWITYSHNLSCSIAYASKICCLQYILLSCSASCDRITPHSFLDYVIPLSYPSTQYVSHSNTHMHTRTHASD